MPNFDCVELPVDQAHHALSVLRLTVGTSVMLFDGQGRSASAKITAVAKRSIALKLTGPVVNDPPSSPALTIAVAVPKADRADWLIEQASQLNVARVQWLATDRSVVKPKEGGVKLEKHHRLAIESAKQCHRTHLLQVAAPITLDAFLQIAPQAQGLGGGQSLGFRAPIFWLDPSPDATPIHSIAHSPHHPLIALIGPEGGWSPREHALLEPLVAAGQVIRVRLTPTVLRIETAAAALAAIVMCGSSKP
ncbi:MAG: 16S rRNA (uracil(1498)-N(3))-methyltransferase [Phycisphaerales bacterium]|nr:16S rRNA (uracil(1498)-N(3))-methyltransferase [Phycisphaerales bacterium]